MDAKGAGQGHWNWNQEERSEVAIQTLWYSEGHTAEKLEGRGTWARNMQAHRRGVWRKDSGDVSI